MSQPNRPPAQDAQSAKGRKKPYQRPAFVREQVFETMALACGKVNPTSSQCRLVRKNS